MVVDKAPRRVSSQVFMSASFKAPIALIAFDRPDYLRSILQGLREQDGDGLEDREIFLFQDGPVNPFSGITYAQQDALEAGQAIFRELFPHGQIFASPVNLGIGLHFDKIETYLFEERGFEAGLFMEDDFEPSPLYLDVIDGLIAQALDDPRIGYVSAIGEHLNTLSQQRARLRQPQLMRQNWAFGLTRQQWLQNRPKLHDYLALIRNVDYRERPHDKIFDLYSSWGVARMESSQDRAKFIVTTLNGGLRLNTAGCYGQYIGKVGVHCDEDMYIKSGFADTQLCPYPINRFEGIDDLLYEQVLAEQRAHIMPPLPRMNGDTTLTFISGSQDCPALGLGFHGPEDTGAWTAAQTAEVNFLIEGAIADGNWELEIALRHYMPVEAGAGRVALSLDGNVIGVAQTGPESQSFVFTFPGSVFNTGPHHQLVLTSAPVTTPADYGSGDTRHLGAKLRTLRLRRVPTA